MQRHMKISELSKEAGVAPSAIRYYVALGLLPPPNKMGLNLQLYDEAHLSRLRQIRRLKEKKGLSLSEIAKVFDKDKLATNGEPSTSRQGEDPDRRAADSAGPDEKSGEAQENRERILILDMAIKLFSEKGFENTRISDITDRLRMGKSTFYLYFKNKRELFMECIDRLTVTVVPKESWDEIRSEHDYVRKQKKRATAFLRAFPGYRGILNEIRGAIGGSDPVMARKAIEAFRVMTRPLLKDLRRAIADGVIQTKHDEALIAYLQLVLAEAFGYWQMIDPRYSLEEGLEILLDIMQQGLFPTPPAQESTTRRKAVSADIEDSTGTKTRLGEITFNGSELLRGRLGDSEVEVDPSKLVSAGFREVEGHLRAEIATTRGEVLEIEVDGEVLLSGLAPFGSIRIPLKRVRSISFGEG